MAAAVPAGAQVTLTLRRTMAVAVRPAEGWLAHVVGSTAHAVKAPGVAGHHGWRGRTLSRWRHQGLVSNLVGGRAWRAGVELVALGRVLWRVCLGLLWSRVLEVLGILSKLGLTLQRHVLGVRGLFQLSSRNRFPLRYPKSPMKLPRVLAERFADWGFLGHDRYPIV